MSEIGDAVASLANEVNRNAGDTPQSQAPEVGSQPAPNDEGTSTEGKDSENWHIRGPKFKEQRDYLANENANLMSLLRQKMASENHGKQDDGKQKEIDDIVSKMSPSERLLYEQQKEILEKQTSNQPKETETPLQKNEKKFFEDNPSLDKKDIEIQFKQFFRKRPELAPLFVNGKMSFDEVYNLSGGDGRLLGGGKPPVPSKNPGSGNPPGSVNTDATENNWESINQKISSDPIAGVNDAINEIAKTFGRK